ncbi:MAG TPA: glycosyltransferase family 2 protein [Methanoregulaceae archaeon]|nr:glycosyltransferase family 2 protein [Methanoregulaceae archaeon]HQP82366.1 glycosyltransferase family 2 protein [Methanoregulaceae archaeon]
MPPLVAIVILNWNGWQDTIECLESVFQMKYPNYAVILVDNGSKDNSLQKIRAYCAGDIWVESSFFEYDSINKPINIIESSKEESEGRKIGKDGIEKSHLDKKIVLIKNEQNFGFAEGNNIGINYALKTLNPDFILLLNNDTVVDPNFLSILVESIQNDERIALIQPKIMNYSTKKIDNTGIMCDIFGATKARGEYEEDIGHFDQLKTTGFFYASGACVLISKAFIQEKNCREFFDKHLFAYHDDVDLAWEARLLGFRVVFCSRSICYHKGSKTAGFFNPNKYFLVVKNRNRVLIKNYTLKNLLWILPLTILFEITHSMADAFFQRNYHYFLAFCRAILWDIKNIKNTLEYRKNIQMKRKVRDQEIMRYMLFHSIELDMVIKKLF